jgi:hypothetical protein
MGARMTDRPRAVGCSRPGSSRLPTRGWAAGSAGTGLPPALALPRPWARAPGPAVPNTPHTEDSGRAAEPERLPRRCDRAAARWGSGHAPAQEAGARAGGATSTPHRADTARLGLAERAGHNWSRAARPRAGGGSPGAGDRSHAGANTGSTPHSGYTRRFASVPRSWCRPQSGRAYVDTRCLPQRPAQSERLVYCRPRLAGGGGGDATLKRRSVARVYAVFLPGRAEDEGFL